MQVFKKNMDLYATLRYIDQKNALIQVGSSLISGKIYVLHRLKFQIKKMYITYLYWAVVIKTAEGCFMRLGVSECL